MRHRNLILSPHTLPSVAPRRAQRNFRERQRVRDRTADARLADLASRIVSLEAEGAALRARARVLEAFVTLRDASPPPPASSPSSSEGGGGGGAAAAPLGTSAPVTHPPHTPSPAPTGSGGGPADASAGGASTAGPVGQRADDDAPLDWAAVAPLWASITAHLRAALPEDAGGVGSPSSGAGAGEAEVATLVHEASALLASVALAEGDAYEGYRGKGAPPTTTTRTTRSARARSVSAPPPPPSPAESALALADAIGLSAAQRAALIAARRTYLRSMASLVRGRAAIAAALQSMPESVPWTGAPASRAFLHIAGAVEALGRHVRAGRVAGTTFTGTAWRDVLTPAQAGSLIVLTSPGRPCLLAMARALAVAEGVEEEEVEEEEEAVVPGREVEVNGG